jgi:hypothetical protein
MKITVESVELMHSSKRYTHQDHQDKRCNVCVVASGQSVLVFHKEKFQKKRLAAYSIHAEEYRATLAANGEGR